MLVILDGWGHREDTGGNAIAGATTPVWDHLLSRYPHTLIRTSGAAVGLPGDQMGNSEVGHLNLGAGRVVYQEFTRVEQAIRDGSFSSNQTLVDAVDKASANNRSVHVIGLLSPGGVHSHESQIHAMLRMAVERGARRVYLHAILDGRDTPPKSAANSLANVRQLFTQIGGGRVANLIGRYFAMDRDHRWPRIRAAYDLMTQAKAQYQAPDPIAALEMAYSRGETDEFVQATVIAGEGEDPVILQDGDSVVFMNYRSDRARQITRALNEDHFDGFVREVRPELGTIVSLTEYHKDFGIPVAFPSEPLENGLGEYLANLGLRQLRLAETEKYAHVTSFFNGGVEEPFEGEDRILIPSPQVATYDQLPQMSAPEVTDVLTDAIERKKHDLIVCNYANPDMVGHSGSYPAAIKAIEAIDHALGRILGVLDAAGGEMLVTADHGNAEQMLDRATGQPHTAHTTNPVPVVYVGRHASLEASGALCDIAPTLLRIMGLAQPEEMTGRSLISFDCQDG